MNPNRSVCVEGGRKPFYDMLMATERKCCDCTSSDSINASRVCMYIFALGAACYVVRNMRPCSLPYGWFNLSSRPHVCMNVEWGVRLCMCVLEQLKSAKWGKGWSVSWVAPAVFFLLAGLEQHRKWEGLRVSLGSSLWGLESQLSLRIGISTGGGAGSL